MVFIAVAKSQDLPWKI